GVCCVLPDAARRGPARRGDHRRLLPAGDPADLLRAAQRALGRPAGSRPPRGVGARPAGGADGARRRLSAGARRYDQQGDGRQPGNGAMTANLGAITPELLIAALGVVLLVVDLVTAPSQKRLAGWI